MSETRPAGKRDDTGEAETRLAPPQPPRNTTPAAPPWPAAPPNSPANTAPPNTPPPYGQYASYGQPPPPSPAPPFAPSPNPPPYGQPYPPQPPPAYGQYGQYGQPPHGQHPMQGPMGRPSPYGHPAPMHPAPARPLAPAFDLTRAIEGMRLGDLLAVGGGTLFVLAKFLPFAALQSGRVGFPYTFEYDGWGATNGLWNLLQLLLWLAAIDVALGGFTERLTPASVPVPKGARYLLIGGLLALTALFGLVGLNGVRVGLFALLLCAGAVAAGGLLKTGVLPGDDRVTMANLSTRGQQPGNPPPRYGSAPPPGGYPAQPPPPSQYGAPPPPPQYGNAPPYNAPPPGR